MIRKNQLFTIHYSLFPVRSAFTLIEVLISLFLLSVILTLIGMAIDIHLRQTTINRTEIEEAQLARALLEKIARDLRSVVVAARTEELTVDTDALSSLFALTPSDSLSSLTESTSTSDESSTSESDESSEEAVVYGAMPGIYGDIDWIQIDTARLPRGEMFGAKQARSGSSFLPDRLSPSKTILYYLGKDTGTISNTDDPRYKPDQLIGAVGRSWDRTAIQYGLFRRQMDRLVSQYAVNEGLETDYEQYDEPLAPEVEQIEFAYYDPSAGQDDKTGEWVEYWDMDERQTLPTAIRIILTIRRQRIAPSFLASWTNTDEIPTVVYSLIVPLPMNIDPPEEEQATEETETTQ